MGALYGFLTFLDAILVIMYGIQAYTSTKTITFICAIICLICWSACTILNGIMWFSAIKNWFKRR